MKEKGYDVSQVDDLVNNHSGLFCVSGMSPDMKTLLEKRDTEPSAEVAIVMFCYQLRKHIGALAAVLGGLDTLVFTGGIGERAAEVRLNVCIGLEFLGIHLDARQNGAHADVISTPESSCIVRIIPAKEELMIARHTRKLLAGHK